MNRSLLPLAVIGFCLTGGTAFAEPVNMLQPTEGAEELAILTSFFGERDVADIRTAIVDINRDNVPELFGRYVGEADCASEGVCRTVALRFMNGDWKVVFDRPAGSIELGAPGFGGISELLVDGVVWTWKTDGYSIDVTSTGEAVAFSNAPAESAELLVYQFGEGALQLFRKNEAVTIEIAGAELTPGATQVIARLGGPGVCGRVMGCPLRVLEVVDGQYRTLLEGHSSGDVIISPSDREGWKDVVAGMPASGFAIYGWDGERYGVAELSIGSK